MVIRPEATVRSPMAKRDSLDEILRYEEADDKVWLGPEARLLRLDVTDYHPLDDMLTDDIWELEDKHMYACHWCNSVNDIVELEREDCPYC